MKKIELDFVRALSAFIIVFFHFSCTTNQYDYWLTYDCMQHFCSMSWGEFAVTIFFMLSGGLLWFRYGKISKQNLKTFYKKRWLAIFPSFLLVWFYMYFVAVLFHHDFCYKGSAINLLLSLFGLDGYFTYCTTTYYFIGEWFLGAIVMLYVLYPILSCFFQNKKLRIAFTILLIACMFYVHGNNSFFTILPDRNLLSCIFCFWIGMYIMEYYEVLQKFHSVLICFIIGIMLLIFGPYIQRFVLTTVFSVVAFVWMAWIGKQLCKVKIMQVSIGLIAKISFQIFLLHHAIIEYIFYGNLVGSKVSGLNELFFLLITYIATIIFSFILLYLTKVVIKKNQLRIIVIRKNGSFYHYCQL